MMRNSKKYLPLIIGMLILFPVFILPLIQTTINNNEHDHDECDHDDHLQFSYMPCECGNPGCTGNVETCPWSLGVPRPAPTLYQPASPDEDGIIGLYWSSSYGASSYKVYRSDEEFGTYTLIATTSSLSYTDTTTDGTWWYYVRAYNSNGYRPSNKIAVEVYFCVPTWYESNEEYNIGDCPVNEWDPYYPSYDDIDVVWASTYDVDMYGKVIRMYSAGYGMGTGMQRIETFTIDTGESLYLKFKAQLNKDIYTGEGIITLYGSGGNYIFFKITFDSYGYGYYPRIWVEFADGVIMQIDDFIVNRVYDFDIMFTKDPTTNLMKYLIFIDQKLEFLYEVNTALYPVATTVELNMNDYPGPGEFFLDNFFLGYVDNEIFPEGPVEVAIPMYYLFAPEYFDDPLDYVESIDMKYRYSEIATQTVSFSLSVGLTFVDVLSVESSVPLYEVIELLLYSKYEVETNEENLIIFSKINGIASDITFYLPGTDPETGVSSMTGWYTFTFTSEKIISYTEINFENTYGLPPDYNDCKNEAQKVGTKIFTSAGGNQKNYQDIESVLLEMEYNYEIGLCVGIPLGKYVSFDFGMTFSYEYSHRIEIDVTIGVEWENNPLAGEMVQIDIYAPPEGSYSTSLDIPPYSATQVVPAPTIDIVSPNNGATVSGYRTITAVASSQAGITKVRFKINNVLKNEDTNGDNGWSWSWNTQTVSNGGTTITCIAYDSLGRSVSDTISVTVQNSGGSDGGCPFLSIYNGEQYITEGLLDIHNPDGIDVIYYHTLITEPFAVNNQYLLRLTEHYKTISRIDKVQLFGRMPNGRLILLPLLSATHSEFGRVTRMLWFSDDRWVTELGADHTNGISEYIDLKFLAFLHLTFTEFIFVIEGNNAFVK